MADTNALVLSSTRTRGRFVAAATYALILTAFWFVAEHFSLGTRIGHMPSTFAAFALLFAPYWFFGFGAAEVIYRTLTSRAIRVLVPGLVAVPYLIYCLPRAALRWMFAVVFSAMPVGISALLEFRPASAARPASPSVCWRDVVGPASV